MQLDIQIPTPLIAFEDDIPEEQDGATNDGRTASRISDHSGADSGLDRSKAESSKGGDAR
jgi:hypothetical protein